MKGHVFLRFRCCPHFLRVYSTVVQCTSKYKYKYKYKYFGSRIVEDMFLLGLLQVKLFF